MRTALSGVMLFVLTSLANAAEEPTFAKSYLEGRWVVMTGRSVGDPCSLPQPNVEDWESYEIEFERSGGTVRVSDDVDLDARFRIDRMERKHGTFLLTINGFRSVQFNPVNRNRARLTELLPDGHRFSFNAYRCRSVPIRLRIPSEIAVSWTMKSDFREALPNVPVDKLCRESPPESAKWIEFDLIGPATISAWGGGSNETYYWGIVSAVAEPDGTLRFLTNASSTTKRLTVRRRDGQHIFIQEINTEFVRCPIS